MFDTLSAKKYSVNAVIESVGTLIGPRVLQSLNSIEKIQPRMMVATFNGNPSTAIICYSPTNASDETDPLNTKFQEKGKTLNLYLPKQR